MENNDNKRNKLAHLVSLLSIVALLICMTVVIFIRINKGSGVDIAESIENMDNEELLTELEEVHTYLETLESAVTESTLTLNTLKKEEGNRDDDSEEINSMIENLDSIHEKLNGTKSDITTLKKQLEESGEYDTSVMIDNFLSVYSRVNELKEQMSNTLSNMESLQGDNQKQLLSEVKRIESSLENQQGDTLRQLLSEVKRVETSLGNMQGDNQKAIVSEVKQVADSMNKSDADILSKISDAEKRLSDKIDQNNRDYSQSFEQVFGSVASGKKNVASALATIGCSQGKDAETGEFKILSFEEISNLIAHSQDITGVYENQSGESVNVNGATEDNLPYGYAAWVNGRYVLGNGKNIDDAYQRGHSEGYSSGYSEGHGTGYLDGLNEIRNAQISYVYHEHKTSDGEVRAQNYQSPEPDGCFTNPVYKTVENTYYYEGCTCRCEGVHWSPYPDKAEDGTGAGTRYLICDNCNHGDHRGRTCGVGSGNRTEYRQEIDYYICGCNKTDYATEGENATIVYATIYFDPSMYE
ncbi:MAG: hypothetical protein MJZ11_09430 [Lachnospiraceae bacterium]|nr:hypothetical protein [Lachnospiraceae bacterium]